MGANLFYPILWSRFKSCPALALQRRVYSFDPEGEQIKIQLFSVAGEPWPPSTQGTLYSCSIDSP